jgi:hypothetical protein
LAKGFYFTYALKIHYMKKRFYCPCFVILGVSLAHCLTAQRLPAISFYRQNWSLINPAAFPRENREHREVDLLINSTYRTQRVGRADAPTFANLHIDKIFTTDGVDWKDDWKIGLNFERDNAAVISNYSFQLSGAYGRSIESEHLDLGFISIGCAGTHYNQFVEATSSKVNWQTPTTSPQDVGTGFWDLNVGIFYQLPNITPEQDFESRIRKDNEESHLYVGASVQQLLADRRTLPFTQQRRQWNFIVGGFFAEHFEPSIWLRHTRDVDFQTTFANGAPLSMDANLRYIFKFLDANAGNNGKLPGTQLWFGAGWSSAMSMNVEIGGRYWFRTSTYENISYTQISLAWTGLRLRPQTTIQNPNSLELHLALNFASKKRAADSH